MQGSLELAALVEWLGGGPHITGSGKRANKATLLRICLGLGILLKDANLIQYTEEGGHSDETPGYIMQSAWGIDEVDTFSKYIKELRTEVVR